VALKVLPAAFAGNADRLMRFEREAQALAALNHTNIAHIHGLEDSTLVMEFVEGEDLAGRLARGPLPIDEVLLIARQPVDAVDMSAGNGGQTKRQPPRRTARRSRRRHAGRAFDHDHG